MLRAMYVGSSVTSGGYDDDGLWRASVAFVVLLRLRLLGWCAGATFSFAPAPRPPIPIPPRLLPRRSLCLRYVRGCGAGYTAAHDGIHTYRVSNPLAVAALALRAVRYGARSNSHVRDVLATPHDTRRVTRGGFSLVCLACFCFFFLAATRRTRHTRHERPRTCATCSPRAHVPRALAERSPSRLRLSIISQKAVSESAPRYPHIRPAYTHIAIPYIAEGTKGTPTNNSR
jgi:hypothetical protein